MKPYGRENPRKSRKVHDNLRKNQFLYRGAVHKLGYECKNKEKQRVWCFWKTSEKEKSGGKKKTYILWVPSYFDSRTCSAWILSFIVRVLVHIFSVYVRVRTLYAIHTNMQGIPHTHALVL